MKCLYYEEFAYILRTETSYLEDEVTLTRCADGVPVMATTLVYPDVDVGAELLPSARYLGLLREGAEEWNLDAGWRRYLQEVVSPYDGEGERGRTYFFFRTGVSRILSPRGYSLNYE